MHSSPYRLGALAAALALNLALAGSAHAGVVGAESMAVANATLTLESVTGGMVGTDVFLSYDFDPTQSYLDEFGSGTGYGDADQSPGYSINDTDDILVLTPYDQQSFSQSGSYDETGSGYSASLSQGDFTIDNSAGATDIELSFSYAWDLAVEAQVGVPRFTSADAYARAGVFVFSLLDVIVNQAIAADFDGAVAADDWADQGSFTITVAAGDVETLSVQTSTEAQTQFTVPVPGAAALLMAGLVGLGLVRRRA